MIAIDDTIRNKFGISVGCAEIEGVCPKEGSELSKAISEVESEMQYPGKPVHEV